MHSKTLATALATVLALGGLGATAAVADDAGSVRNQSPAYNDTGSSRGSAEVSRNATGLGLFAGSSEPVEAWSSEAERQRHLRGEFPGGN